MSGCAKILCWLAAAGLCLCAAPARAQQPGAGDAPPQSATESAETKPLDVKSPEIRPSAKGDVPPATGQIPYDIRYVEGPDGRPIYVPDGVTIDWNVLPQQDGQYITFWPSGRTDPAVIRVSNPGGAPTQIACLSATETFHVLTQQELTAGYGIH